MQHNAESIGRALRRPFAQHTTHTSMVMLDACVYRSERLCLPCLDYVNDVVEVKCHFQSMPML